MCINKKVLGGLAVAGLAIFALAPNLFGAALPLLVVAICPLSMLLMMRGMSGSGSSCSTGGGRRGAASAADEIAELRAEVQRLRTEHARAVGGESAPSSGVPAADAR